MRDGFDRWCLFCDLEIHAQGEGAPPPNLGNYVDDIIHLTQGGDAKRVFENDTRITRIADARRVDLPSGAPALSLLITLGNRRGADPSFMHFENGATRDADKQDGEVKALSAHCIVSLHEDPQAVGRYRMLVEEVQGIGRTPITRLLGHVIAKIAEDRGDRYENPRTGRSNRHRPFVEVYPRRSKEVADALDDGAFLPVELFDTSPVPTFDENPEYSVRRHLITVKVKPAPGRTFRQALNDLALKAAAEGYDRMRISWRVPGEKRGGTSEMRTDLADVGTALFAHRELVSVELPLSDCAAAINDKFEEAMLAKFV